MPTQDLADPLKLCADLKAIFRRQAGGWLDRDTLRRVRELCRAACALAEDPGCRAELGRVEHFAEQLFSHRDRRVDVLREQVLLSLESIEHRSS
jgi:hypothetical protein